MPSVYLYNKRIYTSVQEVNKALDIDYSEWTDKNKQGNSIDSSIRDAYSSLPDYYIYSIIVNKGKAGLNQAVCKLTGKLDTLLKELVNKHIDTEVIINEIKDFIEKQE